MYCAGIRRRARGGPRYVVLLVFDDVNKIITVDMSCAGHEKLEIRMASLEGWTLYHSARPGIKLLECEKCPRSVQAAFA